MFVVGWVEVGVLLSLSRCLRAAMSHNRQVRPDIRVVNVWQGEHICPESLWLRPGGLWVSDYVLFKVFGFRYPNENDEIYVSE